MTRLSQGSGRRKLGTYGWDFQVCTCQLGTFYGAVNTFLMIMSYEEQLRGVESCYPWGRNYWGGGVKVWRKLLRWALCSGSTFPLPVSSTRGLAPSLLLTGQLEQRPAAPTCRRPGNGRELNYMTQILRFMYGVYSHSLCLLHNLHCLFVTATRQEGSVEQPRPGIEPDCYWVGAEFGGRGNLSDFSAGSRRLRK